MNQHPASRSAPQPRQRELDCWLSDESALSGPGTALVAVGVVMFARIRRRMVPRVAMTAPSTASSKFSSGLGLGIFFAVIFGVVLYPLAGVLLERGPGGGLLLLGFAVMFLVLIGSISTLPYYFMEHAVRDFRAETAAALAFGAPLRNCP